MNLEFAISLLTKKIYIKFDMKLKYVNDEYNIYVYIFLYFKTNSHLF